jgi:DUF438 domain-containing protein
MELIRNDGGRVAAMVEYLRLLMAGPVLLDTFRRYEAVLTTATALEVNDALDEVLAGCASGDIDSWKIPVARFIRSVSQGLEAGQLPEYPAGSVFERLRKENEAIRAELSSLQAMTKQMQSDGLKKAELAASLEGFTLLRDHYVALQNELFPLFERATPRHACVKLMWALEDDVLALKGRLEKSGGDPGTAGGAQDKEFWALFGSFFLTAASLEYREQRILLPAAFSILGKTDAMDVAVNAGELPGRAPSSPQVFSSSTGSLTQLQMEAMFKVLPFDLSFIGDDDRVKFYSDPPGRIFPRSPAVVGRRVQNCHPPKSVSTVEEILRSFKSGEKDSAEFWLESRQAFIHIQYFAVRDEKGGYLGTLEVSQDATHLRSLAGEKRLL